MQSRAMARVSSGEGAGTAMVWIGVDVSKRTLDVCIHEGESWVVRQPEQLEELVERIAEVPDAHVVMEATGRYERPLWEALARCGVPCSVVNPAHAHAFRRSLGQLAKTDPVDARLLARMGHALQPPTTELPSAERRRLEALVLRRSQLVKLMVAETSHAEHSDATTLQSVRRLSRALEGEIERLEKAIRALLRKVAELRELDELLQSVPGVGPAISAGVLVHLPELGRVSKREIAALAGLAPYNNDSGTKRGQRSIRAGRTPVRSLLYMAALVATRHNRSMRAMYARLLSAGKPKKLALIAVARKLLTILNALAKTKQPWAERPSPT